MLRSGGLENTPIYSHVYSSPSSSSRTQNPRKRMRSVHCVQCRDKTPSAEERSGWLSGPSCSALSPGGGSGWAGNIGRADRGSQRKGEGGKTFNRPPPSRYSSSISLCYCSPRKAKWYDVCQGAKLLRPTHSGGESIKPAGGRWERLWNFFSHWDKQKT